MWGCLCVGDDGDDGGGLVVRGDVGNLVERSCSGVGQNDAVSDGRGIGDWDFSLDFRLYPGQPPFRINQSPLENALFTVSHLSQLICHNRSISRMVHNPIHC